MAIGIRRENGKLEINPPEDAVLDEDDHVIGLAQSGRHAVLTLREPLPAA